MTDHVRWAKSSYSGAHDNCVEVAVLHGVRAVRDSKDASRPPVMFATGEWRSFLSALASGAPPVGRPSTMP